MKKFCAFLALVFTIALLPLGGRSPDRTPANMEA
jgi:hypothetical protein